MSAGFRVAMQRELLGMSQQDVATKVTRLGYKITQTGIDKIEKRDTARPKCLKELAAALNVTQEWLLTGTEPRHQPTDSDLDDIRRDVRRLAPEEQEYLLAQFRSLLETAMKKPLKKTK
jgi:transcriptional regulator with XRE-family HTH domain